MKPWRNEVRMKVSAARNITDNGLLPDTGGTVFDKAIISLATHNLKGAHLLTFYFCYSCEETFDAIKDLFLSKLGRDYELETVKKYAAETVTTLVVKAAGARELNAWEKEYRDGLS